MKNMHVPKDHVELKRLFEEADKRHIFEKMKRAKIK